MNTRKLAITMLLLVSFHLPSLATANICINLPLEDFERYHLYEGDLTIRSNDNTEIAANIFIPDSEMPANGYPAIIFISSWNFNEYEYLHHAQRFAEKGYVVINYATRGFGCSGGMAEVASENDINDVSAVVDYLQARNDIDMANIGVSGVSYGAGIALIGAAKEPRIKTAVAMSGWGSLSDALYGQQTGRLFWGSFLTLSGSLSGTLDPELTTIFSDLLQNKNIDKLLEWSEPRSPLTYVHLINEKQAPIFISHNYGDNLFQINSLMRFFDRLTGPKYFELNQGSHASTEIPGLFGLENETWENAHLWFDQWLKNQSNRHFPHSKVSILTDIEHDREIYAQMPGINDRSDSLTFTLAPRKNLFSQGALTTDNQSTENTSNSIFSGLDSGASTGIPALSAIVDGHYNQPVFYPISWINPLHGLTFISEPLENTTKIRGIPTTQVEVSSSSEYLQLIAYLYDVDENGIATLITHAPITKHNMVQNQTRHLNMELVATAYNVEKDHRIALVFDTFDLLYDLPTLLPYEARFHYSQDYQTSLTLPVLNSSIKSAD
ncbi:hypothetical protein TDB9533_04245 [Thalassocella blandensis]|nr:hypothetical protein TDB9533_04245 [Thalassocella blandensis]